MRLVATILPLVWHPKALLLLLSAGVAYGIWYCVKYIQVRQWFKNLPQPPGHTFRSGHIPVFEQVAALFPPFTHPHYFFTYMAQKWNLPGIFYIDCWPLAVPQIIITDPDAAAQVLTGNPYPKHPQIEVFLRPFTGKDSIAASNGERWKFNFRMVGGGFTASHIKPMVGSIAEQGLLFHERLKGLSKSGELFCLEEETSKCIFDVIGKIVFGFSLEAQTGGSPLLQDLRESISPATVLIGGWKNPRQRIAAWRKLRGVKKRVYDRLATAMEERYRIMKDEKELPARRKAKSIMDRIILDRMQSGNTAPLEKSFLEDVVTNLKALLLGGHGTTTDTFTFVVMFLSIYPEVMAKMREEHDKLFSPDLDETVKILTSSPAKTNDLEYTNAVIKETLRFFPIGFTIREAPPGVNSITCQGKEYPIAYNAMIILSSHTTQMDPALWKEPKRFRPERFLGDEAAETHRFAWRPFERGPRACIAQDMAMDELRILLLLTVRWFDFETIVEGQNKRKKGEERVPFMDLDTEVGDLAFQVVGMEAGPRKDMKMKVKLRERN